MVGRTKGVGTVAADYIIGLMDRKLLGRKCSDSDEQIMSGVLSPPRATAS